ncbi:MAG: hypothetical protein KDK89_19740 [Alphaproteobacteria bacterium]|nr:hypothetical protein [Alphaproteobacteria bacterium]
MKTPALLAALLLAGSSMPALAAASADEASRIAAALQSYFTAEAGVVTVTPDGDNYNLKLDFAPLFAKIKDPKVTISVTPLAMVLADQGGGKWTVTQDQPLAFAFKVDGTVDMAASIGSLKSTGTFDEVLGAFSSTSADITQFAMNQTVTEQGTTTNVTYTLGAMHYETATTGTGDRADSTMTSDFRDLRETITMPAAPDGSTPPMDFSIAAPSGTQGGTIKGLRLDPVKQLIAWFVARPAPDAIIAGQAELKDKLRAAMPLFDSMEAGATINDMTVNTLVGRFGLGQIEVLVNANGVVEDGMVREKFTFANVSLPEGIVPPWAANLVPSRLVVDFNVTDFNLAAAAKLLIDNFDLGKDPPISPEVESQLQQAIIPKGAVTLGLGPSEILASLFHLKAEGGMTAGPAAPPAGQATFQLKGLDDVMGALQAAPPEMGLQQMAPMVIVAKGLAKQEADGYLSWKVESTPEGSVLVNGTDLMKMGGP